MILARSLLVAGALSLAAGAQAQNIRQERVRFPPGAGNTTISGSLAGYQMADYAVMVRAGQTLSVTIRSDNGTSAFNVTAPGARQALFAGASSGSSFRRALPNGGTYTIRVFLMRQAARRHMTADYALEIGLEGQGR